MSEPDRFVIADPEFRSAVQAMHAGDAAGLARLVDASPGLLRERISGFSWYDPAEYFRDPQLFWFIANNPRLVERMPDTIVEIARVMLDRGIDHACMQYTLELVMTSASAREHGHQLPLMELLIGAGATPTAASIASALAHAEIEAVRALLRMGVPLTAPIAASLGQVAELTALLSSASLDEIQMALAVAVINGQAEAARVALDHGAHPNQYMPVHSHSLPLHQAVLIENTEIIDLLIARGARTDLRDRRWHGTPRDWAVHERKARSLAHLPGTDDGSP